MKKFLSLLTLATAFAALPAVGCAADAGDPEEIQTEDNLTSSDAKIEKEIIAAVKGLDTDFMGTEADPMPYRVVHFSLGRGETLTDAVMVKRLFPKLKGMDDYTVDGRHKGSQSITPAEFWSRRMETPVREDFDSDEDFAKAQNAVAKWKKVKTLFETKLTKLNAVHLGWQFPGDGSVENGTVALTIAGLTPKGQVIAIYGIVVWT